MKGVFCDIDDTLTDGGRLTARAYRALERLHDSGKLVVPITGRPAGWCDHIARFWPVAAVVGENGAFYFRYDHAARRMIRRFAHDEATRSANRARMKEVAREVLAAVPGCAIAADQFCRETDLAIDWREDVAPLAPEAVANIVAILQRNGLTAKVSSIHVNGWYGDYDKLGMTRIIAREQFGLDLDRARARFLFVGDSPNDEPMFGYFTNSVGVANVRRFAGAMRELPAWVTRARGGAGFAELARAVLRKRARPYNRPRA
ncbi:MAG: HAD-IIB family hydrolase [Rhodocyclaceae bacterium]